jgi:hypothetical protein
MVKFEFCFSSQFNKNTILFYKNMSKTKFYKLIGGLMTVAIATMVVGIVSVHADSGNGNGEGEGNGFQNSPLQLPVSVGPNIVAPNAIVSPEGETHGGVVSEIARGLGVPDQQRTQPSVSMDMNGNFSVTGVTVQSVDATADTVTVSLYGFTRTVSLAGATITGGGQAMSVSGINTGDILSGQGVFNPSTHAITITSVVDLSTKNANTANIQAQIDRLIQLLQQLEAQVGMNVSTSTSSN